MRIVILGAGPTGLGAAHRLQELGHTDYTVVDRNPYFGGLATSFRDGHGFTWDFAVHVAHSHYHYVDELMDRLLPDGFYHHQRKSWVRLLGTYAPYPFQNNIRHLPGPARWDCVEGLLALQGAPARKPANFEEWILAGFGAGIARHFMLPYNRKIWSTEPRDMGYQWIGDRVPTIDLKRILRNVALEQDDVGWGPNATFQFPKEGGTGAIWQALGETLPRERVRLSCAVESIDPLRREIRYADGSRDRYDRLVSTLPIPVLMKLAGLEPRLGAAAARLRHTHVQVAGIAAAQKIPDTLAEKTWLYVPGDESIFYRVTPFSIFSPAHTPDPEKHCSFLCEISTPGDGPMHPGDLKDRVLRDLRESGLIDCDPATTRHYPMAAEYGYPVPTLDRDAVLDEILPQLDALGIHSRGRFGGWKYEVANMDHSLMQGVECANRLLRDEEEVTLFNPALVNAGKR
ncbi:MAG: FAD-dependent oxidoreductase [Kiritimatiellia bacterium]